MKAEIKFKDGNWGIEITDVCKGVSRFFICSSLDEATNLLRNPDLCRSMFLEN